MLLSFNNLREIRLILDHRNSLRKLAKFVFGTTDHSFYIVPYSTQRRYSYGVSVLPAYSQEANVNLREGISVEAEPHLSFHESGQMHVTVQGKARAGPILIPSLTHGSGHHIATIVPDSFTVLPEIEGSDIRTGRRKFDLIIDVDAESDNGRIIIYLDSWPTDLPESELIIVERNRPGQSFALRLGLRCQAQNTIGEPVSKGITVIGGWDPLIPDNEDISFLWIHGE